MTVDADGRIDERRYWTRCRTTPSRGRRRVGGRRSQSGCSRLLRASIEKRMMADVPFGVFLSGGVDSTTNVALMSELMTRARADVLGRLQRRLRALQRARVRAQIVARAFGTDHHEVMIDVDDLIGFLPEMIFHQDEPIADWVCVPLHYVSKLARDNGTIVVQVGEGSDELFHGYPLHGAPCRRLLGAVPAPAGAAARRSGRRWLPRALVGRATAARSRTSSPRRPRTLPSSGAERSVTGAIKQRVLAPNGARRRPDAY